MIPTLNKCIFCDDERNGINEKLYRIYYENKHGNMQKIEDSFYCKIHGIIIEETNGKMKRITQESKGDA